MFRKHLLAFLAGGIGGIVMLSLIVRLGGGKFFVALMNQNERAAPPISTPTPDAQDQWQRIVADAAESTVLVQTFGDNRVVRQGSGAVVSSDGLIVTIADIAIPGSFVYQIIADGRILRARIVARDALKNLALLSVDTDGLTVTNFAVGQNYESGRMFLITGKMASIPAPTVFSQQALVSHIANKEIVLDSALNYYVSGATVVGTDGAAAGIVAIRNARISLIPAGTVVRFLENYLSVRGSSQ